MSMYFIKAKSGIQYINRKQWKIILLLIILFTITSVVLVYLNITTPDEDGYTCLYTPVKKHYRLRLTPRPYTRPDLDPNDYKTLNNIIDFRFQILNQTSCSSSNTFILVLVTSAPQNKVRRQTIRRTWGRKDSKVKSFFMLGAVDDESIQSNIEEENKLYGDIVQGNFHDSYKNLTYKSIMALKYAFYHCPDTRYILKTDDDVFVNMPLMKNYLMNDLSPFGAENLLNCHVMSNSSVLRGNWSKWSINKEEFLDDFYPTYCNGAYAIFSPDVAFKLYEQAQKTIFFVFEDVFLYGLVAGKVPEIHHEDTRNFSLWKYWLYKPSDLSRGEFDNIDFLFGLFGMTSDEILEFWEYVLSRPVPSSVYYRSGKL